MVGPHLFQVAADVRRLIAARPGRSRPGRAASSQGDGKPMRKWIAAIRAMLVAFAAPAHPQSMLRAAETHALPPHLSAPTITAPGRSPAGSSH